MIKKIASLFFRYYTFYLYFFCSIAGVIWKFVKKNEEPSDDLWEKVITCTVSVFLSGVFNFLFSYVCLIPQYGYTAEIAAVLILAALSFGLGALLLSLTQSVYRKIKNGSLIDFINENFVGFGVFAFFFAKFVIRATRLNEWPAWSYIVDYSLGFSSRFFIGTLLSILTGDHPTEKAALILCAITVMCIIAVISVLLNRVAKKAAPEIKPAILFFVLCYLVNSGSVAAFWTDANFGRLDMYVLLITLLSVSAFQKAENIYVKYLFLALGCILCNAIYQGFVFMYFSLTVIVILCDTVLSPDGKKKRILLGCFVVAAAMASFLIFQFCSSLKFESAEEMVRYLKMHSDILFDEKPIETEFFGSTSSLYGYMLDWFFCEKNLREHLFVYFAFSIPQIIVFARVFVNDGLLLPKKKGVNLSLASLLTLLFLLPQFLLNVDWGRWTMSGITTVYFTVFYLAYLNETTMVDGLAAFSEDLKKKTPVFVLLLLYMSVFSSLSAENISGDFKAIMEGVSAVKHGIVSLFGVQ